MGSRIKRIREVAQTIKEKKDRFYVKHWLGLREKAGELQERMPSVAGLFGTEEQRPGASDIILGPTTQKGKKKKAKKGKAPVVSVSVLIGLPGEDED